MLRNVSLSLERVIEGLPLETSAFKHLAVAYLRYQLN